MPIEHINKTDTLNEGREKLNNAITAFNETVVEGDSSVEAAQARVDEKGITHTTLKARIDDGMNSVNQQLAETGAELDKKSTKDQLEALRQSQVNQEQLDVLDDRIDQIITTPAENISEQEIIDARDGEISLGANVSKIKEEVNHKIVNKTRQGLSSWDAQASTIETREDYFRVIGDGTSPNPRVEQRFTGDYIGGNKIYVKADMREGRDRAHHLGFSLYNSNQTGAEIVTIRERFPIMGDWYVVDGIVELPAGMGNLAVQLNAGHADKDIAKYSFFDFKNVVIFDLTEIFGLGKEPSIEDIRSILEKYPSKTLVGKAELQEVVESSIKEKVNKDSYAKEINELKTKSINVANNLPLNRRKYNTETIPLVDATNESIDSKAGLYKDYEITYDDKPTLALRSAGESAYFNHAKKLPDLTNVDYIDVYLRVRSLSDMTNLQINFYSPGGANFVSLNLATLLKEVPENGYRELRIPKSRFVIESGNPDWSNITNTRVTLIGRENGDCKVNIGLIEASKLGKGAVYMYFDDALISQYENAFPIMEKYGLKGAIGVITSRPNINPNFATWHQLRELDQAGWLVVSHGHHSYSLANSSPTVIREELRRSQQELFDRGFVFGSKCFVAPQTSWSDEVDRIAKDYYAFARTYSYGGKRDYKKQEFPTSHARAQYGWSPTINDTAVEWKNLIDGAISEKKEIAISWHDIDDSGSTYSNSIAMFDEVCSHIRQRIDEEVLDCVTWQDSHLQSGSIQPIDNKGNQYLVSSNGNPTILTLPINR